MPAFAQNEFFATRGASRSRRRRDHPWNFPLMMRCGRWPGAGHRLHHRPQARRGHAATALRLRRCARSGVPQRGVKVVTGDARAIGGAALTSHPGVDKIAFTGSTGVGKLIGKAGVSTT